MDFECSLTLVLLQVVIGGPPFLLVIVAAVKSIEQGVVLRDVPR